MYIRYCSGTASQDYETPQTAPRPPTRAGADAAPKCTMLQADASKTNFGFEFVSSKSWEAVSKNGKTRTPYNQFCFKISTQAKHANASTGALQTCAEAGFAWEQCCWDGGAAAVTLTTGEPPFSARSAAPALGPPRVPAIRRAGLLQR